MPLISYMNQYKYLSLIVAVSIIIATILQYSIVYINQSQFTKDYYEEQNRIGYSPCKASNDDNDGDCISNKNEVEIFDTNPNKIDSDGDRYTDFQEVLACFDPNNNEKKMDFTNSDKWRVKSGIHPIEGKLLEYFNSNPLGSDNSCRENTFIIKPLF